MNNDKQESIDHVYKAARDMALRCLNGGTVVSADLDAFLREIEPQDGFKRHELCDGIHTDRCDHERAPEGARFKLTLWVSGIPEKKPPRTEEQPLLDLPGL